ncbi:MAG: uroporphyrinogen decarboxylase family protein [Verrucomicrobiota bacterium]
MKNDVLKWADGKSGGKTVSKETLNHRGLIERVSGLDVYKDTPEAYRRAYEALGIDIVNRVPLANAPEPTPDGESRPHETLPYNYGSLGVYDTVMRHSYPCEVPEDVWELDVASLKYEDLLVPVPHPCKAEDIKEREKAIGEIGLYYPMLYTTLFMWGVEVLGWEVFMMAAAMEPERFLEHFLLPCIAKSQAIVGGMAEASDSPFIFVHDDLANAMGPMFQPDWYDEYVFPHYPEIWGRAKELGKKIIFVADGNMEAFLPQLIEAGVDGLMFENPATSVEAVVEHFGQPGRFLIGGIDTAKLTLGTPGEVRQMVSELGRKTGNCPGFAIASCGGLHGNIPMANLEAYFDARAEIGATPEDWRTRCRG